MDKSMLENLNDSLDRLNAVSESLNSMLSIYNKYDLSDDQIIPKTILESVKESINNITEILNEIIMPEMPEQEFNLGYKVCAFTGHRPEKLPFKCDETDERCDRIKEVLEEIIVEAICDGFDYFVCGGAESTDIWAAEIVLKLKNVYEHIKLEIAVPFPEQAARWSDGQKHRYESILKHCDFVNVLSNTYTGNDVYHSRNKYMVNKCSRLIAVYNGAKSGTSSTIKYAQQMKKELAVIDV